MIQRSTPVWKRWLVCLCRTGAHAALCVRKWAWWRDVVLITFSCKKIFFCLASIVTIFIITFLNSSSCEFRSDVCCLYISSNSWIDDSSFVNLSSFVSISRKNKNASQNQQHRTHHRNTHRNTYTGDTITTQDQQPWASCCTINITSSYLHQITANIR